MSGNGNRNRPAKKDHKAAWQDRFEADLADQLARGGTLFGFDESGRYVAATKDGAREVVPGTKGEVDV